MEKAREIHSFSQVHHAESCISAQIKETSTLAQILTACFPGGSITGVPKLRAMQIIEELESQKRSYYTGSIGFLDFSSNFCLNIAIRTALITEGKLYFAVGGGIILDSNKEDEYQESLDKAKGFMEACHVHA